MGKRRDRRKNPVTRRQSISDWCRRKRRTCLLENSDQTQNLRKFTPNYAQRRSRERTEENFKEQDQKA